MNVPIKKMIVKKYYQFYYKYVDNAFLRLSKIDDSRILLLGTPEYGNLGDHAIAEAEINFFKHFFKEIPLVEVTQEYLLYNYQGFKKNVSEKDVLIYTGGGFLGSLYLNYGGAIVRKVLRDFGKTHTIVIMPFTAFYDEDNGKMEFEHDLFLWNSCKELYLLTRDVNTTDLLKKNLKQHVKIIPFIDMAFFLDIRVNFNKCNEIVFILRNDKEKANQVEIDAIKQRLKNRGIRYKESTTRVKYTVKPKDRERELNKLIDTLGNAQVVVTDRLHGMIISLLCGSPCIAIDNLTKKITGVIEQFREFDYLKFSNERDLMNDIDLFFSQYKDKKLHYEKPVDKLNELFNFFQNDIFI